MNTNTAEQAESLKYLGVSIKLTSQVYYDLRSYQKNKFLQINEPQHSDKNGVHKTERPYVIEDDKAEFYYPALTLDDLHRVFGGIYQYGFLKTAWPNLSFDIMGRPLWFIFIDCSNEEFKRTKNHAEDWTEILIWLLENGHVSAEQVNDILKED